MSLLTSTAGGADRAEFGAAEPPAVGVVDVARRPTIETSQFLGLARFEADIASKLPRVAQLQATLENARGDAEARAAGRRLSDVADLRLCKLAGDPRKFGASAWLAGIANT